MRIDEKLLIAVLAAAATVLAYQLFHPAHIVGLAGPG